jgi:hypothetical protein
LGALSIVYTFSMPLIPSPPRAGPLPEPFNISFCKMIVFAVSLPGKPDTVFRRPFPGGTIATSTEGTYFF